MFRLLLFCSASYRFHIHRILERWYGAAGSCSYSHGNFPTYRRDRVRLGLLPLLGRLALLYRCRAAVPKSYVNTRLVIYVWLFEIIASLKECFASFFLVLFLCPGCYFLLSAFSPSKLLFNPSSKFISFSPGPPLKTPR